MARAVALVRILFFAQAQERSGCTEDQCELPLQTSVEEIFATLGERHPPLSSLLPQCRLALDHAFVSGPVALYAGCEIAVIPPVSGG